MFSKQYKTMKIQGIQWVAIATTAFSLFSSQVFTAQGADARIKIDTDRQVGEISPLIYGNFTEHLGRCIYGGIYEPGSPLSDEQGFRKDVLQGTKELNATIVRWPGGNFVSGYHWEDGIGPKDKRPTRIDLAWGARESNQFGTDEFVQWCRKVNTQPYFCVNLGTGTMDEARNWVEYCNVEKEPTTPTYAARTGLKNRIKSSTGDWAMKWTETGRWVIRARKTMANSPWKPLN